MPGAHEHPFIENPRPDPDASFTCPGWCSRDHDLTETPPRLVHRSERSAVPVVTRDAHVLGDSVSFQPHTTEFEVGISQEHGGSDAWIYLGNGPSHQVEVSVESARRLLGQLVQRLAEFDRPPKNHPPGDHPPENRGP